MGFDIEIVLPAITVLVLLYLLTKTKESNATSASRLLDEASELVGEREFEKALKRVDEAIDILNQQSHVAYVPVRQGAYYSRAWILLQMKNYDDAHTAILDLDLIAPNYQRTPELKAWLYEGIGKIGEACEYITQAIEDDETNSKNYLVRMSLYYKLGREELAQKDAEIFMELHPGNKIEAYQQRAEAHRIAQRDSEALMDYQALLTLHLDEETRLKAFEVSAYLHIQLKQWEEALAVTEEWLNYRPSSETARYNRIIIQSRLGRYELALQDANYLVEAKQDAMSFNNRSWYRAFAGDSRGALEDAQKAIALDSTNPMIFSTRGQAYWLLGEYQLALSDYQTAADMKPELDIRIVELAAAQYKLGNIEDALTAWKQFQEIATDAKTADTMQEKYCFPPPFFEALQEIERLAVAQSE